MPPFSPKHGVRNRTTSLHHFLTVTILFLALVRPGILQNPENTEFTTLSILPDLEETTLTPTELPLIPPPSPNVTLSIVHNGLILHTLSQGGNETIIIPLGKFGLKQFQDVPTKVIRFMCNASYPVEWRYDGPGAPFDIISRSHRHIKNFSDVSTYTFSTHLDLTRNVERNTGTYTCTPIPANLTQATFVKLYVPGENLFLPVKRDKTTLLYNSSNFLIPCPISNPRRSLFIHLYRDTKSGPQVIRDTSTLSLKFNPSLGFTVTPDPSSMFTYSGLYFCKDTMTSRVSLSHKILFPKDSYVRLNPPSSFVPIIPGQKQVFICAAKENVTLTFSGDRQPRIVSNEINPLSPFPYLAIFEINSMNISSEHTVINCVTSNDEILHSWEYSTYEDVSLSKFTFDSQKRYQDARYICCSDSFYQPKLEYTFCRTETECSLKKLIFDQQREIKDPLLSDYFDRISYINQSCVVFNPYLKYTLPSGVLRCSVKGVNKHFYRDYMYYFNPYRIYQAYTDDKFDAGKVQLPESIMKLSKTPSKNTLVGQTQRFLCYYSELFLANGIVWSILYENGTSKFLDSAYEYNDMKSNASYSELSLTFDTTTVKGVTCFAPVKDSFLWKNVTGPIFVRDAPIITAKIETKDGHLIRELYYNSSLGLIVDPLSLKIDNNSVYSSSLEEGTFLVLECNGTFPIDFTYSGDGSPKLEYLPLRTINGSLLDAGAYSYSAKLRFLQVDYTTVGKYSCVSSTREFGHRGKEENLYANVNLYVPGERLFIHEENQTFRAWEYRESVLIPCPLTDPRANISLLKFNNETRNFEPLSLPGQDEADLDLVEVPFDPLFGFSLTKNHSRSLFGLYKCVEIGGKNRTSGIVQVYLPSDAIRVTPYTKEVKILFNETQHFKCESKDNVTLTFSDNSTTFRQILYSTDFSSHYPYIAQYEVKVDELSRTNLTFINCTSLNPKTEYKSMHTWELYPQDGAFIDEFIYDNKTREFRCCTKAYRIPVMEWTNCSSVTECTLKQSACLTQNKCGKSDYILTLEDYLKDLKVPNLPYNNKSCLAINIEERTQGLLKCVVKGVHKVVAQALVYYYNPTEDFEVQDGYFLGPKMFDKFDVSSGKIMRLSMDKLETKTTFKCSGSKFFVASRVKWALEHTNGTMRYLDGQDTSTYSEVGSRLEIDLEETLWKNVYCIAPNWKEYYGWRNVSMSLLPPDYDININATTLSSISSTDRTDIIM